MGNKDKGRGVSNILDAMGHRRVMIQSESGVTERDEEHEYGFISLTFNVAEGIPQGLDQIFAKELRSQGASECGPACKITRFFRRPIPAEGSTLPMRAATPKAPVSKEPEPGAPSTILLADK